VAWQLAQHADRDPVRQRAFLRAPLTVTDGDFAPARLRIRNGWMSAAHKPDLNRSLTTKLACEPSHNSH
jgi:hypothetical protein